MDEQKIDAALKFFMTLFSRPELWTIISVAVGGLIALGVQMFALREIRKQRSEDRKRTHLSLGRALLFKIRAIHINYYGILKHIEDRYEIAKNEGFEGEHWQIVISVANPPNPINFTTDELSLLLELEDDEVTNLVLSLDDNHNGVMAALKIFIEKRELLNRNLKPERMVGMISYGDDKSDEFKATEPARLEINNLVESIRRNASYNIGQSKAAIEKLQNILRDKLGNEHRFTVQKYPSVLEAEKETSNDN